MNINGHVPPTSPGAEEAVPKHDVRLPKEDSQPSALLYPVQTGQAASQTLTAPDGDRQRNCKFPEIKLIHLDHG